MTPVKYTLTGESITVIHNGESHTVQRGAANFSGLKKALVNEEWDEVQKHLTVSTSIYSWAKGKISLDGNTVKLNGEELPSEINDRVMAMARNGEDPISIINFWDRLSKNPSWRSVKQLWPFLQHEGIPLTKGGYFLAYKAVKSDYKDVHSGSFDNSPGVTNEMPRNKISDDPQQACHEGFHVGALSYAQSFGGSDRKIVICKVDPQDVVCVPYDSSKQKMRVCKYVVIGNYGSQLPSTALEDDEGTVDIKVKEEEKPATSEVVSSTDTNDKPKKATKSVSKQSLESLMKQSLEDLRKYAASKLNIVGASKIPGGKLALAKRILDVQRD